MSSNVQPDWRVVDYQGPMRVQNVDGEWSKQWTEKGPRNEMYETQTTIE